MIFTGNIKDYSGRRPLALSLGMFDGVHKGHQEIIRNLNSYALHGYESAILTFWPHPRLFFNPDDDLKLLTTIDEKTALLERFGVQNLFFQNFDEDFRNMSSEDFVADILVKKLNVKHLIIGHDHVFGKNRSGNYQLLKDMAPELGFTVEEMKPVDVDGEAASSTRVRKLLASGKILEANNILGYFYKASGKVVDGKRLGRTLGYPTANIATDALKLLPKKGAYIVEVWVNNLKYKGMLSVGTNPTVNGKQLTTEVYILDFKDDIYGEIVSIQFREFLHEEIRFESIEKLIDRLDLDKKMTDEFQF